MKIAAKFVFRSKDGALSFEPTVYSYGVTGYFHPAAFLASIKFAQRLERENKLIVFTTIREAFEDFLVRNKWVINTLVNPSCQLLNESLINLISK